MNVQIQDDTMSAVWGDVRTGKLEIWFERRDLHNGNITSLQKIINEDVSNISIYPNPVTNKLYIDAKGLVDAVVHDITGRVVLTQRCDGSNAELNLHRLKNGTYIVTVSTHYGAKSIEIQKQ